MLQRVMGAGPGQLSFSAGENGEGPAVGKPKLPSPVAELVLEDVGGLLLHVPELNSIEPLGKKERNPFILKHSLASL